MHQPRAAESTLTAVGEWKRGWPVILSAGIGYGTGGAMILLLGSLFIKPMRDALGWSTAAVTFAPIVTFVWALCYPLSGAVIDRFGSRRVALTGALGIALCAVLMAVLPISKMSFYATAGLMGIFASMTAVSTYGRGVASWFKHSVGLAFGIALSGSAVVAIVAQPLTGQLIAAYGWRAGFLAMAAIVIVIGLPVLVLMYRERPGDPVVSGSAEAKDGIMLRAALRDSRFWCYLLSFTLACIPISGTLGHLQPLLGEKGISLNHAISLGVVYALAMSLGKVVGGILLDRAWPFAVAAGITTLAAGGSFGLAAMDLANAYLVAALLIGAIGAAQGAESDFIAFFVLRSFGMLAFSTIVGVLAMAVTFGIALGAWLYGVLFDRYGDYEFAGQLGGLCFLGSTVFILTAGIAERLTPSPKQSRTAS